MDSHLIRFQDKKFLFLDFETFNLALHESLNLPWQAALIYTDSNGNASEKHDLYLKWDTDLKIGK